MPRIYERYAWLAAKKRSFYDDFFCQGIALLNVRIRFGALAFTAIASLFAVSDGAYGQDYGREFLCLDELPELLEQADLGVHSLFFCENFADGVQISLRDFILRDSRRGLYQGGGPALLDFRHSNYQSDQENRLETILVPRTKELWDVNWRDSANPDVVIRQSGNSKIVVWGTNMRVEKLGALPMPLDDNSMRVFTCSSTDSPTCFTHYSVTMCDGYQYPKVLARNLPGKPLIAKPTIRVVGRGFAETEKMFEDYGRINLLVRRAINRIMEISCN